MALYDLMFIQNCPRETTECYRGKVNIELNRR